VGACFGVFRVLVVSGPDVESPDQDIKRVLKRAGWVGPY